VALLVAIAERYVSKAMPLVELVPLVVRVAKNKCLVTERARNVDFVAERLWIRQPFEKCSHTTSVSERVRLFVFGRASSANSVRKSFETR
jgi:hypothetical protein